MSGQDYFNPMRSGPSLRGIEARLRRVEDQTAELTNFLDRGIEAVNGHDFRNMTATDWADVYDLEEQVSIRVGEIAYGLRSALDFLVYETAFLDSGSEQPRTQFPVCQSAAAFRKERSSRLRGISAGHMEVIRQFQPFAGCEWLVRLASYTNEDKHQRLHRVECGLEFDVPGYSLDAEAFALLFHLYMEEHEIPLAFTATFYVTLANRRPVLDEMRLLSSEVRSLVEELRGCFDTGCGH